MSIGTMNGETRSAPRSMKTLCWARRLSRPPIPVENRTPVRAWSTEGSPASAQASLAAAMAKCTARSVRRISFGPRCAPGSKSGSSPPIWTGRSEGSIRDSLRTPLLPASSPSQKSSIPMPTGVTGPRPVITTLRRGGATAGPAGSAIQLGGDEVDRLADRFHALHLLLGDGDAEFLLQGQDGLDQIQGVGVKILLEPGLHRDVVLGHGEVLRQDLSDPTL